MTKRLNNKRQVPKLWRFLIFCFLAVEINNVFVLYFCAVVVQWPHGLQQARLPCPSLSPVVWPNSCPLSWWCHPTISSFVNPLSSCPQSFPAPRSLPVSQLFASGGQSFGTSTSVFPTNIQGWFPFGLTDLMSLQSKGLSSVFSNTTVWKHQFFDTQSYLWSVHDHWKNHSCDYTDLCWRSNVSAF